MNSADRDAAFLAMREGWPVLLTPPVIGMTYGILARQAGLEPLEAIAMSVFVFAGASQFAALELLRTGAGAIVVILTVALINSRHLLMATALRQWSNDRPLAQRLGLAYLLTDEAFAMGARWYQRGGRRLAYYAAFGVTLYAAWVGGSTLGVIAGAALPDPHRIGLDFAITATFVAIVVLGIRSRSDIAVAILAAVLAAVLRGSGFAVVAVLIAGALAPLVALRERA